MAIICAKAEAEHGRVLRESANLYQLEGVFARALAADSLDWITQIDPYGDTVFNRIQIPEFLREWSRLYQYATSDAEHEALLAVEELARFCLEKPHRYLRFFGD